MAPTIHVRLEFDGLRLFITQAEVYTIEIIADVQTEVEENEKAAGILGWVAHGEEQYPVFSLSGNLEILLRMPRSRRYCVILQSEGTLFGLTCENLIMLPVGYRLNEQEMPVCMRNEDSPIHKLALYEREVACMTTASQLMEFITTWGADAYAEV